MPTAVAILVLVVSGGGRVLHGKTDPVGRSRDNSS